MPETAVDTKQAQRRSLSLKSFDDLAAELDAIEASLSAGTLTTTGNWTPGENLEHLAKFMRFAIDGFPNSAPAPVRWLMILFFKKKAVTPGEPIPAGFKLPKAAAALFPVSGTPDREGLELLRAQVERIRSGERFTQPSPIFGKLTHEQWVTIQLKHCDLHLSFLQPGLVEAPAAGATA